MAWNPPGQKPGKSPLKPPAKSPTPRPPASGPDAPPPGLDDALRRLAAFFGDGLRPGRLLVLALLALAFVYGVLGVHQVREDERCLVLRNGREHVLQGPGLHWNPPGIDSWRNVNVGSLREATLATEVVSQDEELVAVTLTLRYRVADARAWLLGFQDADAELLRATESALQRSAARLPAAELRGPGQQRLLAALQASVAAHLRGQGGGLVLDGLSLAEVGPPSGIAAAIADVDRARADLPLQLQQARESAQQQMQQARSEARKRVAAAEAEKAKVLQQARADAQRLAAVIAAARIDPAGTRARLYEEAVADVLARTPTVIVGEQGLEKLGIAPAKLSAPSPLPPAPDPVAPATPAGRASARPTAPGVRP